MNGISNNKSQEDEMAIDDQDVKAPKAAPEAPKAAPEAPKAAKAPAAPEAPKAPEAPEAKDAEGTEKKRGTRRPTDYEAAEKVARALQASAPVGISYNLLMHSQKLHVEKFLATNAVEPYLTSFRSIEETAPVVVGAVIKNVSDVPVTLQTYGGIPDGFTGQRLRSTQEKNKIRQNSSSKNSSSMNLKDTVQDFASAHAEFLDPKPVEIAPGETLVVSAATLLNTAFDPLLGGLFCGSKDKSEWIGFKAADSFLDNKISRKAEDPLRIFRPAAKVNEKNGAVTPTLKGEAVRGDDLIEMQEGDDPRIVMVAGLGDLTATYSIKDGKRRIRRDYGTTTFHNAQIDPDNLFISLAKGAQEWIDAKGSTKRGSKPQKPLTPSEKKAQDAKKLVEKVSKNAGLKAVEGAQVLRNRDRGQQAMKRMLRSKSTAVSFSDLQKMKSEESARNNLKKATTAPVAK